WARQDTSVTTTAATVPTTTTTPEPTTVAAPPPTPGTTTATGPPASVARAPRPPAAPLPGLGIGSRGPEVLALEQRLSELHYDPGAIDGAFDSSTAFPVVAFQKVTGMARTSRATDDVVAALQAATGPAPLVPARRAAP